MKTAVITGANTGIGLETAIQLARKGFRVVLACRNQEKAVVARAVIQERVSGAKAELVPLDLSSFASVRAAAQHIEGTLDRLDVLVNNAGAFPKAYTQTEDGFEFQFGAMHLGHFLLTQLLQPLLAASAPARVINVSSTMHRRGKIDESSFRTPLRYRGIRAYGQAKLANVMFSRGIAQRWQADGITSYSLHPGAIASDIYRNLPGPVEWIVKRTMTSTEQGAYTSVYCATEPGIETHNGLYFDKCNVAKHNKLADDQQLVDWLWDQSLKLTGLAS